MVSAESAIHFSEVSVSHFVSDKLVTGEGAVTTTGGACAPWTTRKHGAPKKIQKKACAWISVIVNYITNEGRYSSGAGVGRGLCGRRDLFRRLSNKHGDISTSLKAGVAR